MLYPLLASVFPSPTPAHALNSLGNLWSHVFWHSAKDHRVGPPPLGATLA